FLEQHAFQTFQTAAFDDVIAVVVVPGHEQHRRAAAPFDLHEQIVAVEVGHHDIADDAVDGRGVEHAQRLQTAARHGDHAAIVGQRVAHRLAHAAIVVYHQDA